MRTNTVFIFKYVSKVFVRNFLKSLERKKATGLDELPPGMLKNCHQHLIDPLRHIINFSLQSGIVPSAWKKAKVVPLFKSVDKNKTKNYRPISICQLCLNCWKRQCTPKYQIILKKMDFWIVFNLDIEQRDLHNLPQRYLLMRSEKLQDKVSSSELYFWISVKPI